MNHMLAPIADQNLSDCMNFIGTSPAILDLLLLCQLSKLRSIAQDVAKLVDVVAKVGY